ncbi:desulfoferrodoxin [bacterium]|nr:desulfoferrodoxin [bacterium]
MTEKMQVYKCEICGNVAEVLHSGAGELVCCGKPMKLLNEKTEDLGAEKHVPVVEITDGKMFVKVGSMPHPSEENHYIEYIEVISRDNKYIKRKYLSPGEKPELELKPRYKDFAMRAYCNLHGLWGSDYTE